jgi:hypothetical protein
VPPVVTWECSVLQADWVKGRIINVPTLSNVCVVVLTNKELRVHTRSEVAIETRVGDSSEVLIASGRTSLVKNPKNAMLVDHYANRYLHTAYRSVSANR